MTWATKFCSNRKFTCYLDVTEVNKALSYGHFRKGRQLIPTLHLRRKLVHDMMDNTIGVDNVDSGMSRSSTCTPAIVPSELLNVKNHEGSYNKKAKNQKFKQEYQKQRCANFKTCNQPTISCCMWNLGLFLCNICFVENKFEAVINE